MKLAKVHAILGRWFSDEEGDVSVPDDWATASESRIAEATPPASMRDAIWYRLHGLLPSHILLSRMVEMPHDTMVALCEWAKDHPHTMLFKKLERVPGQLIDWRQDLDRRRGELALALGDDERVAELPPPAPK